MAKNWAIAIGIDHYESNFFASQRYAKRDAEAMRDAWQVAQFDRVYCFAENLPDVLLPNGVMLPSQPTYRNLLAFFELCFREPFLTTSDNLWFFFSGQGLREFDRQYLLPQDANFHAIARTAFAVDEICNYLRSSGADNIILLLDADRRNRDASVVEPDHPAGVVLLAACQPMQRSWESELLHQGIFTQALLEVMNTPRKAAVFLKPFEVRAQQCATLEQMGHYLRDRIPELYRLSSQSSSPVPDIAADPTEKLHFILFPERASPQDITVLKQDAYRFIQQGHLVLAEQICQRIGAALQTQFQTQFQTRSEGKPPQPSEDCVVYPYDMDLVRLQATLQQMRSPVPTPTSLPKSPDIHRTIPLLSLILEDSLASDRQLNYQPLQHLLRQGQWQQADDETRSLMQQAVGGAMESLTPKQMQQEIQELLDCPPADFTAEARESAQRLLHSLQSATVEEIASLEMLVGLGNLWQQTQKVEAFPFTDLFTIDHLWVKYSQGRFGFSIQKRIYWDCGGIDGSTDDVTVWKQFEDRVGWQQIGQSRVEKAIASAPADVFPDGYFPSPNFLDPAHPIGFWRWWQLVQNT